MNSKQLFPRRLLLCSLLFSVFFMASCGDDEPEDNCMPDFAAQVATGEFQGSSYTVVGGKGDFFFGDSTEIRFSLYNEASTGDVCDPFNFDRPPLSIIFTVPNEVGSTSLSLASSLTFNNASVANEVEAVIAICGTIEIQSITNTQITGRMDVTGDSENFLNGNFTAKRCF